MVNGAVTNDLKTALVEQAQALGFVACGVAAAGEDPVRAARLDQWLAEGRHGQMEWMEGRAHHRRSPQGLWPEASSVIALGMSYAPAGDPLALAGQPDRGWISAYARGADYHDTVKKALKHLARWLVDWARSGSRFSSIPRRSWKSRWPKQRGSAGKASTPTL